MTQFISKRIEGFQQSEIRNMTRECDRVGGINLGQGLGDLPAPASVQEGAIAAIRDNYSKYALPEGTIGLREAIAAKLQRDNGIEADPLTEIVVTNGTTGAFATTLQALLNPGDGILLFEPYYGYHLNTILLSGNEPHFLGLALPAFSFTEEGLISAIRPNTRAILVCTPANPSGKVFSKDELKIIAKVAAEHDLLVITDEIYEYITYDGRKHISPATVEGLRERTVSVMGFSKTFSITGWRVGYVLAPPALARAINLVNDLLYVCAPTPLQYGVAKGLAESGPAYFEHLSSVYQLKRDIICEGLAQAGLNPLIPQGAYYVLAEIGHLGYADAKTAALALLEQTGVAGIPGTAFFHGEPGNSLIRFCFAKDDDSLAEAARRLQRFRPA
ncbi:MAG: pyridoxal phosphate-dependent aminotransferase [Candidatus Methylumidiphilus sp.]